MAQGVDRKYIVADQGLYRTFIGAKLDVRELEGVELLEGKTIVTPGVGNPIRHWASSLKNLDPSVSSGWQRKILDDSNRYLDVVRFAGGEQESVEKEIGQYCDDFTTAVRLLNKGAAPDDCEALAFAAWIVKRLNVEACVVTEDGDLLGAGQILASYTGVTLKVKSVFEILKSADLPNASDAVTAYCKYWGISDDIWYRPGHVNKGDLRDYLTELARQSKVAFHPKLNRRDLIASLLVK